MKVIRRVKAPDNSLELIVTRTGDVTSIGFAEFGWHVHPDMIGEIYYSDESPMPEPDAIERFISDIVSDRLPIGIRRMDGVVVSAWVCDKESRQMYSIADPDVELRCWSGAPWTRIDS